MESPEKLEFIKRHTLPMNYLEQASIWFDPIIGEIIKHHNSANSTLIIGINGSQGSGKTTLADYLSTSFKQRGLKSISISIDDFYLDNIQRQRLAKDIHPLLATRGVPGTHDLELAFETLSSLKAASGSVLVPRFDKATDNKRDKKEWAKVEAPVDIIILEGWCVGIPAQQSNTLINPINELESKHDSDGVWRRYVNKQLIEHYQVLWDQIDHMIMLKAPSFDCVFQWRLEQEEKLLRKRTEEASEHNKIMSPKEIGNFIQHYERLTKHALNCLANHCDHVFELDTDRQIKSSNEHKPNEGN